MIDDDYLPLYAEKRCGNCRRYRSQHVCIGHPGKDSDMKCVGPKSFTAEPNWRPLA